MKNQEKNRAEIEDLRISLRERCDKIEPDFRYLKHLTREEIQEEEERLVSLAVTIDDLEDSFKLARIAHKSKINPLREDYNQTVGIVRSGKKWVADEVYIIFNRDNQEAEYYNGEGILVNRRPLAPGEAQISIFNPGDK